jgi:glyoxylase-like metal-dependent hydrolase (beta-lactamase superfamily II)/ferredoxin
MADSKRAHPSNVDGDFFVDTTCIDCPVCRQVEPKIFGDADGQAVVVAQPKSDAERLRAAIALVSCPAGSIGSRTRADTRAAIDALPEKIAEDVYWCGFASKDSYGAQSYLITRPDGNVLVDSPRFTQPLVERIEALGGIRYVYLTHQDDVADHERYRKHFAAEGIIHSAEVQGALRSIERQLRGDGPWNLDPDLRIIATPGHTKGHTVLLFRNQCLFTGDHLYSNGRGLSASRDYNWHSWDEQLDSIEKLTHETFSWVLPGHGYRYHATPEAMREAIHAALTRLRSLARSSG